MTSSLTSVQNGTFHIEYFGATTSAEIFAKAQRLTAQTGGTVTARTGQDAPNDQPGGDEWSFGFDFSGTINQFHALCAALCASRIRVKSAQWGQPGEDAVDDEGW